MVNHLLKKSRNQKIYKDYINKKLSLRELGVKYGLSHTRIRIIIKEWKARENKDV
jgi:Mor family transcriptional regulator